MCWTYIFRKAVFSRVRFQIAYKVTWNSWMDLESGAVGKNKLSEKNIAQSVQWQNPCLVQHVSKCFWAHKHFTMNLYYHMVSTAKSRAHHSFASLEDMNSVFQEASLVTQLSVLCFEGFISQLRRKVFPILAGTSWRVMRKPAAASKIPKWRMASNHRRTLPMQDAPLPSMSPNHKVEGSFRCHSPDCGTKQLWQQDVAHHQAGEKAEDEQKLWS